MAQEAVVTAPLSGAGAADRPEAGRGKARAARIAFYGKQGTIHARSVTGKYHSWRVAMVWLTQLVFYGAVWCPWPGGDGLRQALLLDIAHEKFYVFGWVLWPQDALLLTFLLIAAATGLFLVTALAGRLFCGFACPQTVYTEIFTWIEARVEGDHLTRMRRDLAPWTLNKILIKGLKHGLWWAVAAWTAITFVGYFSPIRDLLPRLMVGEVGPWEGFWLFFYAAFLVVMAGYAREAVCQHMCPYSRFQGVMGDADTRTVAYDPRRGEPRGARRQAGAGDCVDCSLCVQVCPTGIDIREGAQYACINCGLCIDACEPVMAKVGRAGGLIRFLSEKDLAGQTPARMLARPRLLIYGLIIVACALASVWLLTHRPLLRVDVLRDRGALAREVLGADLRPRAENSYTLKLINLAESPQTVSLEARGLPGLELQGPTRHTVPGGSILPVTVTLSAPLDATLDATLSPGQDPADRVRNVEFVVTGAAGSDAGNGVREASRFFLPQ